MAENTEDVRIQYETVWQSITADTYSGIVTLGIIGCGVYLHSAAMQWIGFLFVIGALLSHFNAKYKRRTPQEAADYLKEKFGVTAR